MNSGREAMRWEREWGVGVAKDKKERQPQAGGKYLEITCFVHPSGYEWRVNEARRLAAS